MDHFNPAAIRTTSSQIGRLHLDCKLDAILTQLRRIATKCPRSTQDCPDFDRNLYDQNELRRDCQNHGNASTLFCNPGDCGRIVDSRQSIRDPVRSIWIATRLQNRKGLPGIRKNCNKILGNPRITPKPCEIVTEFMSDCNRSSITTRSNPNPGNAGTIFCNPRDCGWMVDSTQSMCNPVIYPKSGL